MRAVFVRSVALDWLIWVNSLPSEGVLSSWLLLIHIGESLSVCASVASISSSNVEGFLVGHLGRVMDYLVAALHRVVSIAHLGEGSLGIVVFGPVSGSFQFSFTLADGSFFLRLNLLFGCHFYLSLFQRPALVEDSSVAGRVCSALSGVSHAWVELWVRVTLSDWLVDLHWLVKLRAHRVLEVRLLLFLRVLVAVLDNP